MLRGTEPIGNEVALHEYRGHDGYRELSQLKARGAGTFPTHQLHTAYVRAS